MIFLGYSVQSAIFFLDSLASLFRIGYLDSNLLSAYRAQATQLAGGLMLVVSVVSISYLNNYNNYSKHALYICMIIDFRL